MAKTILTDVKFLVNGVDLSNHVSQVEVDDKSEEVDLTGFGAKNKETGLGVGDATISATFFQDFAAGAVHSTLAPLKGSNTPFPVEAIPTGEAVSATNPGFKLEAILPEYKPLSGNMGAASTLQVTFKNKSPEGLQEITS
jgi:hypothetical protein